MATSRTRNLKLYLSSGLSVEARANLELLDRLGAVYYVDNTDSLNIRSTQSIRLLPGDPSVGGSGGANFEIGSASTPVGQFFVYADTFVMKGLLKLQDKAAGGSKSLTLQYKSDLTGAAESVSDRTLSVDVQGQDRNVSLGGDLKITSPVEIDGQGSSLQVPASGVAVLENYAQTLKNKLISASTNTLVDIADSSVATNANINVNKLGTGEVSTSTFNLIKNLTSDVQQQLNDKQEVGPYIEQLTGDITASGPGVATSTINPNAVSTSKIANAAVTDDKLAGGIAREKLAAGIAEHVLINTNAGVMSSEQFLSKTRGGTGQSNVNLVFPSNGRILSHNNVDTITGKSIDGLANSLSNIPYSSLLLTNGITNGDVSPTAAIEYEKLDLNGAIVNADVSPTAAIAGTKVNPDFGNQLIKTTDGLEFEEGGYKTKLKAAQSGQSLDLTFKLPSNYGTTGFVLATDGAGDFFWVNPVSGGTVTSIGFSAPTQFVVSNTPITTNGTIDLAWQNQAVGSVLAGPGTGVAGVPTFRALVATDLPNHTHTPADIVGLGEAIDDQVAGLLTNSTSISWSYNDVLNTLAATVSLAPFSTSDLSEGSNLYYTNSRVYTKTKAILTSGTGVTFTSNDVTESISASIDFSDFNTDDITEGSTNLFFTTERAQDAIGSLVVSSSEIASTYNDTSNTLSFSLTPSGVSASSYGTASSVGSFTVDSSGRVTAASNTPISISSSQVSDFNESVMDVVGNTLFQDSSDIDVVYNDVSDAATLSVKKEFVSNKTQVTPTILDTLLIGDASDSDNLKKVTVAALLDLGGGSNATDWTNADGVTKSITHGLNSRDVIVQVFDNDTFESIEVNSIARTTLNVIDLTSSEAPATSWRVLIKRL